MLLTSHHFQKGEDVARQIRFYLHVLYKKDSGDRNSEILLRGYIYNHEESCPNQQCQLKLYKKNMVATILSKQRMVRSVMANHLMMS